MSRCPICQSEFYAVCGRCGYDLSRDCERFPTLSAAPSAPSAARQRERWKQKTAELVVCKRCGGTAFTISRRDGRVCCLSCGAEARPFADATFPARPKALEACLLRQYAAGARYLRQEDYPSALYYFESLGTYQDAAEKAALCRENISADTFSHLAAVKQGGKWGFLNESRRLAIPPKFDETRGFLVNGLAPTRQGSKWGCIDTAGDWVIPPKYDALGPRFSGHVIEMQVGDKWGAVNDSGTEILSPRFSNFYDVPSFGSSGLAAVRLKDKYGFMNASGVMAIAPKYDSAWSFDGSGLARVALNGKEGYIDTAGNLVILPKFYRAAAFDKSDFAPVILPSRKIAIITQTGEIKQALDITADFIMPFSENGLSKFCVINHGLKYGLIDENGKLIAPTQYETIDCGRGPFVGVRQNGKWGLLDLAGKIVAKPEYDQVRCRYLGFAAVKKGGNWGLIDPAGAVLFPPQFADKGVNLSGGLLNVKQEEKWGCIDSTGAMAFPPQFAEPLAFSDSGKQLAAAKVGGMWGYVDTAGRMVIAPQFDEAAAFSRIGYAPVKSDGRWGFIDEEGLFVLRPQYESAQRFFRISAKELRARLEGTPL